MHGWSVDGGGRASLSLWLCGRVCACGGDLLLVAGDQEEDLLEAGLGSAYYEIEVDLGPGGADGPQESADNRAVFETLREQARRLRHRLLPWLWHWGRLARAVGQAGAQQEQEEEQAGWPSSAGPSGEEERAGAARLAGRLEQARAQAKETLDKCDTLLKAGGPQQQAGSGGASKKRKRASGSHGRQGSGVEADDAALEDLREALAQARRAGLRA